MIYYGRQSKTNNVGDDVSEIDEAQEPATRPGAIQKGPENDNRKETRQRHIDPYGRRAP